MTNECSRDAEFSMFFECATHKEWMQSFHKFYTENAEVSVLLFNYIGFSIFWIWEISLERKNINEV